MKRAILLVFLIALFSLPPVSVQAQSVPACSFQPDGSIACAMGGGSTGGAHGGSDNRSSGGCNPGSHVVFQVIQYNASSSTCTAYPIHVDNCSGQVLHVTEQVANISCELPAATPPRAPCTTFSVSAGGITCINSEWQVKARVAFPEIYLDVRPFPATLVRWPTALRDGGLPDSSGSGGVDYIPYGGGTPGNPHEGDWRALRLTLTLQPVGPMFVTLPHIGDLILPNRGATGTPTVIQWEVPSHPAAGGGPLARTISGLDELPGDIPVFVGRGRAPYKLFWELSYYEYDAIRKCMAGPNGKGGYNCSGGTGHREIMGYEWKRHSEGGEIPPTAVQNLPASLMAHVNGVPDAYWDNNLTLRRMDDNNRVDNPRYQRSWNWDGSIYWAVREGQGQSGWPGQ